MGLLKFIFLDSIEGYPLETSFRGQLWRGFHCAQDTISETQCNPKVLYCLAYFLNINFLVRVFGYEKKRLDLSSATTDIQDSQGSIDDCDSDADDDRDEEVVKRIETDRFLTILEQPIKSSIASSASTGCTFWDWDPDTIEGKRQKTGLFSNATLWIQACEAILL